MTTSITSHQNNDTNDPMTELIIKRNSLTKRIIFKTRKALAILINRIDRMNVKLIEVPSVIARDMMFSYTEKSTKQKSKMFQTMSSLQK
mmetsp:Transcript_19970/g.59780  ORF Transcript_19970/g.59780 Transcript_19970/m.59780 type:complete len:89 (+) Transcript_19970:962-1228(+)